MRAAKFPSLTALVLFALAPASAQADTIIDLTTAGAAPGIDQGAIFAQSSQQPAGTGVFQPFVRIQGNGTEAGYNTDARPVQFQTKDQNQWTHSLLLSSLGTVTSQGTQYYQFTLDINEQGNKSGSLLSMDSFKLYLGNSGSLTNYNNGFGSNAALVYDMSAVTNTIVNLNAKLNGPGTGVADMTVDVPVSLFQGLDNQFQYVYLYSAFGNPYASNAGFEQWSALEGTAPSPRQASRRRRLSCSGCSALAAHSVVDFAAEYFRRSLPTSK